MRLPFDVKYWPPDWMFLYEERWAIMHFDGGVTESVAKVRAEIEIRRMAKES